MQLINVNNYHLIIWNATTHAHCNSTTISHKFYSSIAIILYTTQNKLCSYVIWRQLRFLFEAYLRNQIFNHEYIVHAYKLFHNGVGN